MKKAVLLTTFNRPDVTMKVFEEIRRAKPPRLYISSDGPRVAKEGEREKVLDLRERLVDAVDWECEVKTLFRDKNLSCREAMSGAITWLFENEEDGIILEDDCVPNESFFKFCEELLDYYKDDKRVMHISGNQFIEDYKSNDSYYFAKIEHCWGWATWADRWKYYGTDLKDYSEENLKKFSKDKNVQNYWGNILARMKEGTIDSWAYQWTFKIVEQDGFCINPSVNLVSNIGFNSNATHTKGTSYPYANMRTYEIDEIKHPKMIRYNKKLVQEIYKKHFHIKLQDKKNYMKLLIRVVKKIMKKVKALLKRIKRKLLKEIKKLRKSEKAPRSEKNMFIEIFEKYRHEKRFEEHKITFMNKDLLVPDVVSFAYQIKDIFIDEVYKFKSDRQDPVIFDCGANIGMSIQYFKRLYPNAKVKAYEPDSTIFKYLVHNTKGLDNVSLTNKAVWIKEEKLEFNSEGADGGSIFGIMDRKVEIDAVKLKDEINKEIHIDFLKLDIEGPEYKVLQDCDGSLDNVDNIFIEYHSFKDKEQELGKLLELLRKNSFRYFLDTIRKPKYPYINSDDSYNQMDLQVNIFAVKV
jgi:FkbM family methyltransferase